MKAIFATQAVGKREKVRSKGGIHFPIEREGA